jgi:5-hydroxyisourate hydrolase
MAGISVHALNAVTGKPGAGMRIDFSVLEGGSWRLVKSVRTNAGGRTDEMILKPEDTKVGQYELLFYVDEYFAKQKGLASSAPAFIEKVPVRFSVFDATQAFHLPVLCTPWSCSICRGS